MSRRSCLLVAVLAIVAALLVAAGMSRSHERDTLWRIVDTQCVPHALQGSPAPCAEVAMPHGRAAGDVVFKDRNGPLQFLLLPTARVTGIEDARLLRADAPPYVADAWAARRWMEARHGGAIPADDIAIALNSPWSRSQDQLHLHVSCVRADLKARLKSLDGQVAAGEAWTPLPGDWNGHPYLVRRLAAGELGAVDPIRDVAARVPGAAAHMGRVGLAVVGATFADGRPGFWLMATHVAPLSGWFAGVEGDVQDHDCAVLPHAA